MRKSNKVSQEETPPPRTRRRGESGSHETGRPGPLCAGPAGAAASLPAAASLGDTYCTSKGSDGEKTGKHSPKQPFPTSCFPKSALDALCLPRNGKAYINSKEPEARASWLPGDPKGMEWPLFASGLRKEGGEGSAAGQLGKGQATSRAVPSLSFLASGIPADMQGWLGNGYGQTGSQWGK